MDIRKVKKLIELLDESGIAEIEITEGEESVRISRHPTGTPIQYLPAPAPAPVMQPVNPPRTTTPPSVTDASPVESAAEIETADGHAVQSPMVGTYYESASPGTEPFVKVGDQVEVGDTLCIIEAMKMMNQIESDVAGQIGSIHADNGEPVEFDQVLFIIT